MATEKDYQDLQDRVAALREAVTNRLAPQLIANPALAETIVKQIDDMLEAAERADAAAPAPPDKGLSQLAGIGPDAAGELGKARIPGGVVPYDDTITSER